MNGVCVVYIAYGEAARREATYSLAALRSHCSWPAYAVGEPVEGARHIEFPRADPGGRWAKLNAYNLVDEPMILYLDADTRPMAELEAGFRMLEAGWELVICPSSRQAEDLLWHAPESERAATLFELGYEPLQLQAGVWFVRRTESVDRLFSAWRCEWLRWEAIDQGALLRALDSAPVKIWLLGWPWNGGAVIQHRWGAIARA